MLFKYKISIKTSIIILIVLYTVGMLSQLTSHKTVVMSFSGLNLLITFLFFIQYYERNLNLVLNVFLLFALGFVIEVIGVKTGLLFGTYKYGNSLGLQIYSVPVIMGFVWAGLIMALNDITKTLVNAVWQRAFLVSCMMVFLDFFIEQACQTLDFWTWNNQIVPVQNFIMWGFASFIFSSLDQLLFKDRLFNKMSYVYYGIQLVFFIFVNLVNIKTL